MAKFPRSSVLFALVASCAIFVVATDQIVNVESLLQHLETSGSNARVGFLSSSNYASVKTLLPANVKPYYVKNDDQLVEIVLNGTVIASLMTGLPQTQYDGKLNVFGSTVITMHSVLMAPDYGFDYPHGVTLPDLVTYDLARAINAAVASVQFKGIDQQIALKNAPKEIARAHTCKDDEQSQFTVPNKNEATGLLKSVLQTGILNVLADGPYDWGDNDGNYLVDPPVGFYPDLLQAIVDQFANLSGPDGVLYGNVKIVRLYSENQPFPWYKLFNGEAHISEPYFIYDAPFYGSNQPCKTTDDCPNVANLPERKETCSGGYCRGEPRPRSLAFKAACTATATEAQFITKRQPEGGTGEALDGGAIAALVLLSVTLTAAGLAIGFLVYRERIGKPIFAKGSIME